MAGQVVLKVDSSGNIGYIELNGDPDTDLTSIKLKADNISLEGLVTVNGKFKVHLDGTIEAVNAKFNGEVIGSYISSSIIESTTFISESASGSITIENGKIKVKNTAYDTTAEISGSDMWIDYISVRENANFIKGAIFNQLPTLYIGSATHQFITTLNKDSYTYPPAPHTHSYATMSDLVDLYAALRLWVESNFVAK